MLSLGLLPFSITIFAPTFGVRRKESGKMKKEDTVKLISAEGFELVVDKEATMVSQTIHNMLTSLGYVEVSSTGKPDHEEGLYYISPYHNLLLPSFWMLWICSIRK
ncbi:hypothetical protein K1719_032813 [Acacia pycnantha]|nr:hypothetical protein K1719_032813 [Acacia pycnantha]